MKNKSSDLRDHLFETIERLKDAKSPERVKREIDRSKAVVAVAGSLIDLAKVEVVARRELGNVLPEFIADAPKQIGGPAK